MEFSLQMPDNGGFPGIAGFGEPAYHLFFDTVVAYHDAEGRKEDAVNPFPEDSLESLFFSKCYIDTLQWHAEDDIRDPAIQPEKALAIKRRIDGLNQERTDLVESIDSRILSRYAAVAARPEARVNSETPAWALDRLSILALKIYHTEAEVKRPDAPAEHIERCRRRLDVLYDQRGDLCRSIDELLLDISSGVKYMRTYRQMKMYNDPALNPVLYKTVKQKTNPVGPGL